MSQMGQGSEYRLLKWQSSLLSTGDSQKSSSLSPLDSRKHFGIIRLIELIHITCHWILPRPTSNFHEELLQNFEETYLCFLLFCTIICISGSVQIETCVKNYFWCRYSCLFGLLLWLYNVILVVFWLFLTRFVYVITYLSLPITRIHPNIPDTFCIGFPLLPFMQVLFHFHHWARVLIHFFSQV